MRKLEFKEMEIIKAEGCGSLGWAGFGALVLVGAVAITAAVATGGAAAAFMATAGAKYEAAALTAAGVGAIYSDCY